MRIALSGYYGCGNTGDEAVLAGILEAFRQRTGPGEADFTVLSADPCDTERRHQVRAVERMRLSVVRQTLRESDLLLSGGGSLLQDTTSLRSLLYYLWVVRMARLAQRPVMFYAQGIGPLRRRVARVMTRLVANSVQQITVRDEDSAELLLRIGVHRPPVEVTADPAFALTPDAPERAREVLTRAGLPDIAKVIGLALRPWKTRGSRIDTYVDLTRCISDRTGAMILLLPMHPPGDLELSEAVARSVPEVASVLREPVSPQTMLGIIGSLSGLVAMRLHALIFGAIGGVPLVALGYDPKVRSLMTSLGQPDGCLDTANFRPEAAVNLLVDTLSRGDALRKELRDRAREQSIRAMRNVDLALTLAQVRAESQVNV